MSRRPALIPLSDRENARDRQLYKVKDDSLLSRKLWGHLVRTFLATFFAILTTLFIGSVFGSLTGVLPPQMGSNTAGTAITHGFAFAVIFSIVNRKQEGIRVNPYISLFTLIDNEGRNWRFILLEWLGQAMGATGAIGLVYGVLRDSPGFIPGIGGDIINTYVGWAFFLECLAGFILGKFLLPPTTAAKRPWSAEGERVQVLTFFLGYVYFQNYKLTSNFPILFALTIGFSMVFTYPFLGATTHNPLRWLGACIIESTCGAFGSWIYPVGPFVGILVGYIVQRVTTD